MFRLNDRKGTHRLVLKIHPDEGPWRGPLDAYPLKQSIWSIAIAENERKKYHHKINSIGNNKKKKKSNKTKYSLSLTQVVKATVVLHIGQNILSCFNFILKC